VLRELRKLLTERKKKEEEDKMARGEDKKEELTIPRFYIQV
jgi:hypothetical protein